MDKETCITMLEAMSDDDLRLFYRASCGILKARFEARDKTAKLKLSVGMKVCYKDRSKTFRGIIRKIGRRNIEVVSEDLYNKRYPAGARFQVRPRHLKIIKEDEEQGRKVRI